jgi:dTDP-4-amino-4,6-dideoxygalactose transaminase
MEKINRIAKQHQIHVVADACHAITAKLDGKGMAQHSDLTCFSMHPLKNLNVWGDGGVIVTNDEALANKLYLIRNHGLKNRDICEEFAYNSRLDTIQAVIAQYLLDNKMFNITDKRQQNASYLDRAFKNIPQIKMPKRELNKNAVYHLYMGLFEDRNSLQSYLQQQGIDAKVHYPVPMHLQPAASDLGYVKGDFPVTEFISENCLSLPVHEFITQDDLDHMILCVTRFYQGDA